MPESVVNSLPVSVCLFAIHLLFPSIAPAVETVVYQQTTADIYEQDNTFARANAIVIDAEIPQEHNFHAEGDEDWVKFLARAGVIYEIKTINPGANSDIVIELYDVDGITLLEPRDDRGPGEDEAIRGWSSAEDGVYYVKIRQFEPSVFGENTQYDLSVIKEGIAPFVGFLVGKITDAKSNIPIKDAQVKLGKTGSGISDTEGNYAVVERAGTYQLKATALGYESYEKNSVTLPELATVTEEIALSPSVVTDVKVNNSDGPLDISQSENPSLTIALRVVSSLNQMADWWLVAFTPDGWFYFDLLGTGTWQSGVAVTYQGPLFEFNSIEVPVMSGRSVGTYVFYFAVDLKRNELIDPPLFFDGVIVNIE